MKSFWRRTGLRSALRINRKNTTFLSAIFVLVVWIFVMNALLMESYDYVQEADLHPTLYTAIAQCGRKENGEFDCPDIRDKGPTLLRRCQLVLTRMLRVFDLIAKKHGIRYWLYRGTLIGAVRHHGHNPFDDDVDIAIPKADFEKFINYGVNELPDDIFFQTEKTDPYYKVPSLTGMLGKLRDKHSCYKTCLSCKHADGLQLDMFVLESDAEGNFLELYHGSWFWRRIFGPTVRKTSEIFPLTEVNFDGFLLPAPREWRKMLKSTYGDFMKVPYKAPPGHIITDVSRSCEEIKGH